MALGVFVAGRYSGTLASSLLGLTEQGYEITTQMMGERIEQSDGYALALIEIISQCMNFSIQMNALEWTAGVQSVLSTLGTWGSIGTPAGRLGSSLASSLVLSATAGTPAAGNPNSISASRAIISPAFAQVVGFNSKLRRTPMRLDLLPSDSGVSFVSS